MLGRLGRDEMKSDDMPSVAAAETPLDGSDNAMHKGTRGGSRLEDGNRALILHSLQRKTTDSHDQRAFRDFEGLRQMRRLDRFFRNRRGVIGCAECR